METNFWMLTAIFHTEFKCVVWFNASGDSCVLIILSQSLCSHVIFDNLCSNLPATCWNNWAISTGHCSEFWRGVDTCDCASFQMWACVCVCSINIKCALMWTIWMVSTHSISTALINSDIWLYHLCLLPRTKIKSKMSIALGMNKQKPYQVHGVWLSK